MVTTRLSAPVDREEVSIVVQFECHPERASVAQRGIWARRFAPTRDRGASLLKPHHYRIFYIQE